VARTLLFFYILSWELTLTPCLLEWVSQPVIKKKKNNYAVKKSGAPQAKSIDWQELVTYQQKVLTTH
jgi:hypothetical protein